MSHGDFTMFKLGGPISVDELGFDSNVEDSHVSRALEDNC